MAAVAKVEGIETGDTLADPKSPILYEPVPTSYSSFIYCCSSKK
jgi:hypothetical protein